MDQVDLNILEILQKDARTPNVEIARRIGLAPSATLERIRKLERQSILLGYAARIEPVALGWACWRLCLCGAESAPARSEQASAWQRSRRFRRSTTSPARIVFW